MSVQKTEKPMLLGIVVLHPRYYRYNAFTFVVYIEVPIPIYVINKDQY
jgi:hypothetical protein